VNTEWEIKREREGKEKRKGGWKSPSDPFRA